MEKYNILGVITARGGSRGIPSKNIKELGGKPLICYSINPGNESKLITHLIVSTDDKEIAEVAKKCGGYVPFIRPKELAEDKTPHLPVMQHAVKFMEEKEGIIFDYVVILQPTSPFRNAEDIDVTLKKLIDTGADSAVSLSQVDDSNHPYKMRKFKGEMLEQICGHLGEAGNYRRQDQETFYKWNSSVFAAKRDTYMVKNSLYGDTLTGVLTSDERKLDIDNEDDWNKAEKMLENLKKEGHTF